MMDHHLLQACLTCNPELQAKIFDVEFLPTLGLIVSQFIVVGGLVAMLHKIR